MLDSPGLNLGGSGSFAEGGVATGQGGQKTRSSSIPEASSLVREARMLSMQHNPMALANGVQATQFA